MKSLSASPRLRVSASSRRPPPPNQPELALYIPTTLVPGPHPGEWLIKQGKPVLQSDRLTTAEAARILGLGPRNILTMCEQGHFVEGRDWFRPGRPKGKIYLHRAAVMARLTKQSAD